MSTHASLSRRDLLKLAGAAPVAAAAAALPAWPARLIAAAGDGRQVAGYDPALLPDAATLAKWLQRLHDFGPIRMTGTPQCRAFEEFLAKEVAALGFALERDQFRLTSWECRITDCSISVVEDGGARRDVDVIAYYPFGGSTRGRSPAMGRVLYVPAPGTNVSAVKAFADSVDAAALANSIVVVDMPLIRQPATAGATRGAAGRGTTAGAGAPAAAARGPLGRFPEQPPPRTGGASPAGQGGREIMEIFERRCKGLVMCYTDVSDEAARHNYLPFSDQHRALPCIWAGAEGSRYLKSVSGKATASIRCDATLTPDARADTLLATLPGRSDEVVFLTTQTDGPNECNENGGLGVLALATYWSKVPAARRPRTIVASFPTAHYAAGAVADPVTGSGRRGGTRGVLEKWPTVASRIVGQISLEQMGAMEWVDLDGRFAATGHVASERWIVTPAAEESSARMFMAATSGEDPKYSNAAVVHEAGAPGEGGALRSRGLPGIGLMGQPSYFFRCDPKGVLEKLNPNVMRNQIAFATKMTVLMSRLTKEQLQGKTPISDADVFG